MTGRRLTIALLLGLMLPVSGCVVPIPRQGFVDTRANVPTERPAFLVEGATTRAEVLLQLGDPDGRAPDGSWFIFGAREHRGGVAFVMAAGGGAGGIGFDDYRYRRLVITFDGEGVVASATLEDKACIDAWLAAGASAGPLGPQCLDLTGGDVVAKQAEAAARQSEAATERPPEPVVATARHVLWTPKRQDTWSPAGLVVWGSLDVTGKTLVVRAKAEGDAAARVLLRQPLADITAAECRDYLGIVSKGALAIQRRNGPPLLLVCVESDALWAMGDAAACASVEAAIHAGLKGAP